MTNDKQCSGFYRRGIVPSFRIRIIADDGYYFHVLLNSGSVLHNTYILDSSAFEKKSRGIGKGVKRSDFTLKAST